MLDVHGIAVSGPTFPADIWHLYMEAADASLPDTPFPPPTTKPQWLSWHGTYQYGLVYGTTTTTATTDDDEARTDDDDRAAPPQTTTTVETICAADHDRQAAAADDDDGDDDDRDADDAETTP